MAAFLTVGGGASGRRCRGAVCGPLGADRHEERRLEAQPSDRNAAFWILPTGVSGNSSRSTIWRGIL